MCGIFGIVTSQKVDVVKQCLEGLQKLEYRGYDSAGIVGIYQGHLRACKRVGKIQTLIDATKELQLDLAIAHTRWATHGKASSENAHPHLDHQGKLAIVHNGIVENFSAIKEQLIADGIPFRSETDSEVIAQLIAKHDKGDFLKAVSQTIEKLQGSYAFSAIHKDYPDCIIAAAQDCPLVIATCKKTKSTLLSSDSHAFKGSHLELLFLQKGEIAILTPGNVTIHNSKGKQLKRAMQKLTLMSTMSSKGKYPHFMLKEIYDQPETIQTVIDQTTLQDLPFPLESVKRILIIGCGSSCHAGEIARSLLEDVARIPTRVEIASEFRYTDPMIFPHDLVIAVSQSGETADTLAAVHTVKQKGAPVLGICNVPHSTLTRIADKTLYLNAGPEISVCSTKAFTSQVTLLTLLALHLAKNHSLIAGLKKLPDLARHILCQSDEIQRLAKNWSHLNHFFFLGRRHMYPTSMEAALKLKEISYLHATAYAAGEMKHGPIALVCPELCTIAMCGNLQTMPKLMGNLMEIKARGGPIVAFAPQEAEAELLPIVDELFTLPSLPDALAPIPYSIAGQLFAYHFANHLGMNIDKPRNLAKSVTVE